MSLAVFCTPGLVAPRKGQPFAFLDDEAALLLHDAKDARLVTAVFPWGTDAVFNRFQAPELLREWRLVAAGAGESDAARQLRAGLEFVEAGVGNVEGTDHDVYVLFIAD
jgi:hypothetical protein